MKLNFTESRETFPIEELLPEGKEIELKAKLAGYEVERVEIPNKNSDKPKLR